MYDSLPILSAINPQKLLLFDGAMGTLLWSYGHPRNVAPRLATLNNAELVKKIHQEYLTAGADILTTNTFCAEATTLSPSTSLRAGLPSPTRGEGKVVPSPLRGEGQGEGDPDYHEINRQAVKLARSVAGNKAYVAGDVAPCMAKNLSPAEMVLVYGDQIKVLAEAGIDLLVLETFTNLESVQLAIHAAFEVTGGKIPLVVMMTVNEDGDLASGEDVGTLAPYLKEKRVAYFGFNCSFGPESVLRALKKYGKKMGLPLAAKPSAGVQVGITAEEFAKWGPKFIEAGAKLIGGCCGTTPEYIHQLKKCLSSPPSVNTGSGDPY